MSTVVKVKQFVKANNLTLSCLRTTVENLGEHTLRWHAQENAVAQVIDPDTIRIGTRDLTIAEAESFYLDLVSAGLAIVTQGKVAFEHTFKVSTQVVVDLGEDNLLEQESIAALRDWLRHVLGIRPLPQEEGREPIE